jgi:TolA-binding protein
MHSCRLSESGHELKGFGKRYEHDFAALVCQSRIGDFSPSNRLGSCRDLIERGRRVEELEREVEHKEARIEELRNQMTARENQSERIEALERRIEDQQDRADAPFPVKWWRWWQRRG